MPASPTTRQRRQQHEKVMLTDKQRKRIAKHGKTRMESKPSDYTVTDPESHDVRRAIEDRAEEQALERALRPGWED